MNASARAFAVAASAAIIVSASACSTGGVPEPAEPPSGSPLSCTLNPISGGAGRPGILRVYQPDWAGPVLFAPGQVSMHIPTHRFCAVEGEWTVPRAFPTINCANRWEQTDGSSLWIALDGWSGTFKAHYRKDGKWHTYDSTDILQAGSESDVPCYHGGKLERYPTNAYFWIEWSGTQNIRVAKHARNLPLNAGDRIDVRIVADTSGQRAWKRATLWLLDETTGRSIERTFDSGCVDCGTPFSRPATLYGNTVEWIVEATFYSAVRSRLPNTLDDFGSVRMDRVVAVDQDGVNYDLTSFAGATPNIDWMTWNGVPLRDKGTLLACASIDGASEATFSRAPYVIVTPGQQGKLEPKPQHCR